eukprot:1133781-Rhodomonas_salina.3
MALHKNLSFLLYAGIAGAVSASIAHRVVGYVRTELCLLAVACVLVFCNLLHIVMPLKMVGVLVIMVSPPPAVLQNCSIRCRVLSSVSAEHLLGTLTDKHGVCVC